jgi:hypothetical protein
MEGTQALEAAAARGLQRDVFADYFIDPGPLTDEGYVLVTNPPGHVRILGSRRDGARLPLLAPVHPWTDGVCFLRTHSFQVCRELRIGEMVR